MTEMNEIDWIAFGVALIFGPVIFAALTFWAYYIPVIALLLGGPVYLLFGTPLLIWYLHRFTPKVWQISLLALASLGLLVPFAVIFSLVTGMRNPFDMMRFYLFFGVFFAPLWGYCFAHLYICLARNFARN